MGRGVTELVAGVLKLATCSSCSGYEGLRNGETERLSGR